jgi:hypothetical protein
MPAAPACLASTILSHRVTRLLAAAAHGSESCDVAELGDREIAAKLRKLQVMAVDRLYALSD